MPILYIVSCWTFFSHDDTFELPPEPALPRAVSGDKSTAVFFEMF